MDCKVKPKFTDDSRFTLPYVPVAEQGEGYLQKRFKEIEERQKQAAKERLEKCIEIKRRAK